MPERRTVLELSIESDSEPIRGSIAVAGGEPQAFGGWIELAAAIEAARGSVAATEAVRGSDISLGWSTGANSDQLRQAPS
jgi:hypothetical protein